MMSPLPLLRSHYRLVLLGLAGEAVYALYFVRQFPLLQFYSGPYVDMGQITGHSHSGFWTFVLVFALLFGLFGLAWRQAGAADDRNVLWLILGFGALFGVTMTFVYPITANDIFSYIDQSLVIVQYHQNPISTSPASFPHDPLMKLSGGWAGFTAPYGPLGLVIDALPALVVRRNLLANLILLKLMFSGMTLICAYLVHQLLQHVQLRYAVGGALLVAWNPFILFEISANGHNDIAMMMLVLLALLWVVEGGWTLGPVFLVASGLVKYASLVLLPLLVIYGVTQQPTRQKRYAHVLSTGGAVVALAVLAYAPFWTGTDTFRRSLLENQFYLYSFGSVVHNLFVNSITLDQATRLGRLLFIPVYGYALWLSARSQRDLLNGCFLATFFFLALAITNVKPWYVVWPSILAAALPRIPQRIVAILMASGAEMAAALNIFVWVWLGVTYDTLRPINNVSYLMIFVMPSVVLLLVMVWRRLPDTLHRSSSTPAVPPH